MQQEMLLKLPSAQPSIKPWRLLDAVDSDQLLGIHDCVIIIFEAVQREATVVSCGCMREWLHTRGPSTQKQVRSMSPNCDLTIVR